MEMLAEKGLLEPQVGVGLIRIKVFPRFRWECSVLNELMFGKTTGDMLAA